jgi:hypothetical protein
MFDNPAGAEKLPTAVGVAIPCIAPLVNGDPKLATTMRCGSAH